MGGRYQKTTEKQLIIKLKKKKVEQNRRTLGCLQISKWIYFAVFYLFIQSTGLTFDKTSRRKKWTSTKRLFIYLAL